LERGLHLSLCAYDKLVRVPLIVKQRGIRGLRGTIDVDQQGLGDEHRQFGVGQSFDQSHSKVRIGRHRATA
jgi:hypothetical protein